MSHYANVPIGEENDEDRARVETAKVDFILAGHEVDVVGIGYGGGPNLDAGKMVWSGTMHMSGTCKRCGKTLLKDAYRDDDLNDWGEYVFSHFDEKREELNDLGFPTNFFPGLGKCDV